MVSLERKRDVVVMLKTHQVSERRSCQLLALSRTSFRYRKRIGENEALIERLRLIAFSYPRFGYRRASALLRREGEQVNHKRVFRLWQKFGLSLPKPKKRKRARPNSAGLLPAPRRPNEIWSYDFVFDACAGKGRRLKILTIVDEYTRECLATIVNRSLKAADVVETLTRLIEQRGAPQFLRSDNGSEFAAIEVSVWLKLNGIKTIFIEPGRPWQNAKCESFNGRLRDECLNQEWFNSIREAKIVIEKWRKFYNSERPHSSLNYQTPKEMREKFEIGQSNLLEKETRFYSFQRF